VLALLAERAPEIVSRAEFEAAIWPEGYIEPANLTQTIYMLRKALGSARGSAPIETVTNRGYRLAAPVRRLDSLAPAALRQPARIRMAPAARLRRLGFVASLAAILALAMFLGLQRREGSKPVYVPQNLNAAAPGSTLKPPSRPG